MTSNSAGMAFLSLPGATPPAAENTIYNTSNSHKETHANKKEPWACPRCTYLNPDPLHLVCEVCGEARAESDLHQYQEEANRHEEKQRVARAPPDTSSDETTTENNPSSSDPSRGDPPREEPEISSSVRVASRPMPDSDEEGAGRGVPSMNRRPAPPPRGDGEVVASVASRPASRRPAPPRHDDDNDIALPSRQSRTIRATTATRGTKSEHVRRTNYVALTKKDEEQRPGAYSVQDQDNTERRSAGFISPHYDANNDVDEPPPDDATFLSGNINDTQEALPPDEPVVAQVVSEEDLEQEVRERLLREQQEEEERLRRQMLRDAVEAQVLSSTRTPQIQHAIPEDGTSSMAGSYYTASTGGTQGSGFSAKPSNFKEQLFGDNKGNKKVDIASTPEAIRTRQLLPWSVYQNDTTKMWIASISTHHKGRVNYSFTSRQVAQRVAKQMAPPTVMPFDENPTCFVCNAMFAVFRRPCHCRNCGVCICSSCAVNWSSKMVPETYNIKNNSSVKICLACDWLSLSLHEALLQGDYERVQSLHKTGNINLNTPFCNVKGELLFPVHCAVLGGNLKLLKWLIEDQSCTIQATSVRGGNTVTGPLLSSKGRSLLTIAQANHRIDFIRYLVVQKKMAFEEERDLDITTTLQNYARLLVLLPESIANGDEEQDQTEV